MHNSSFTLVATKIKPAPKIRENYMSDKALQDEVYSKISVTQGVSIDIADVGAHSDLFHKVKYMHVYKGFPVNVCVCSLIIISHVCSCVCWFILLYFGDKKLVSGH